MVGMELTTRQKDILETIVAEYIKTAEPVSSGELEKKHAFGIKPAMLRIEMEKLTNEGYLSQPFVSAGRIPTDRGYRFFVDSLLEKTNRGFDQNKILSQIQRAEENIETNSLNLFHSLTKTIAQMTSNLTISYWPERELLLKEGWSEIAKEPEFDNAAEFSDFMEMVETWEQNILSQAELPEVLQIWIGKENPCAKAADFSTITSQCFFPGGEKGILAIFGPKRMDYNKNIKVIKSLTNTHGRTKGNAKRSSKGKRTR